MRHIGFLFFVLTLSMTNGFSQQSGNTVSASLKPGHTDHSIMILLKSERTFSGQLTNIHFTVQIPDDIPSTPLAAILKNPIENYLPTENYHITMTHESGFFNYLFSAVTTASPEFMFKANTETEMLEIAFSGEADLIKRSRLGHLANGGNINKQMTLYIEVGGLDCTCYSNIFYGDNAFNDKSYHTYSFVPIQAKTCSSDLNTNSAKQYFTFNE